MAIKPYGYQWEPEDKEHYCPVCNAVCDTIYKNTYLNEIMGCENCIEQYDAGEVEDEI